jgi:hypothetical protein
MVCIVEGHGDRESVPVLIRRLAAKLDPAMIVHIPPPLRIPKNKLLKPGELERAVELAARRIAGHGAVLILLDSDDDCPAQLGPELLQRATSARRDVPLAVVIAKREFESWFLAAAESLRGNRGLATDLNPPPDPETIRGAKEWLTLAYDEAAKLLTDLRELAQHLGRLEEFESRLGQIQQDFSSLSGLKFRLREAGLVKRQ